MVAMFKEKFLKLFRLNYSPKVIAMACAVGMGIGFSPYPGLHTAMSLAASFLFGLPVYPILLMSLITNPFTIVLIYAFCYKIGKFIIGDTSTVAIDWADLSFTELLQAGKSIIVPLFIGSHLLALIFGVITYFVIYFIVVRYRESNA